MYYYILLLIFITKLIDEWNLSILQITNEVALILKKRI